MSLTPQQNQILDVHRKNRDWVCSTAYEFIRDHRKRISELNKGYLYRKGFTFIAKKCDGRCGQRHKAPVVMRKVVRIVPNSPKMAPKSDETPKNDKYPVEKMNGLKNEIKGKELEELQDQMNFLWNSK